MNTNMKCSKCPTKDATAEGLTFDKSMKPTTVYMCDECIKDFSKSHCVIDATKEYNEDDLYCKGGCGKKEVWSSSDKGKCKDCDLKEEEEKSLEKKNKEMMIKIQTLMKGLSVEDRNNIYKGFVEDMKVAKAINPHQKTFKACLDEITNGKERFNYVFKARHQIFYNGSKRLEHHYKYENWCKHTMNSETKIKMKYLNIGDVITYKKEHWYDDIFYEVVKKTDKTILLSPSNHKIYELQDNGGNYYTYHQWLKGGLTTDVKEMKRIKIKDTTMDTYDTRGICLIQSKYIDMWR